jgi:uncharacterized membrane protein
MAETRDIVGRGPGGGMPRWAVAVLLGSLMLNMVFVGAAAGRLWSHYGFGWHAHQREGGMRAFLRALPDARREELGKVLRYYNREAARAEREKVRSLRQAVRDAIVREPFDKAALEAALAEVNAARLGFRQRVALDLGQMVAQMTPEERKLFAEKGLRRRGRRGKRHGDAL